MTEADRERWDSRYRGHESPVVPLPPTALFGLDRQGLVAERGRALDVACGRGATSLWLALRGLAVDAVDVSPVALRSLTAAARAHGVADKIRCWPHDLDAGLPSALTDGFVLVACQRFREPRLYAPLARALAPGGLLAISVLSSVGAQPGRFQAAPSELLDAFSHSDLAALVDVLEHREADGVASLLARARVSHATR